MDKLDDPLAKLDGPLAKVAATEDAAKEAVKELHEVIREVLATRRHGDRMRMRIAERTGYTVQHVNRIGRGLTSGKSETIEEEPGGCNGNPEVL